MQLRTVKEIVIHLQSFRNIELWYQGIYFLKFTIYVQSEMKSVNPKKLYACPFAISQCNIFPSKDSPSLAYDSQIVAHSYIDKKQSAFYSKSFHLKYFEEEIELNDLCHFRLQVSTFAQQENNKLVLEVGLWFFDSYKKDFKDEKQFRVESKEVRNLKFIINDFNSTSPTLHQYVPILFQDQYFSITSMTIHAMNVDHKIRFSDLQLSDFAAMSQLERKALVQKLKSKRQVKKPTFGEYLKKQLTTESDKKVMQVAYSLLKGQVETIKKLHQEYKRVFQSVMTDSQMMNYTTHLTSPRQLQDNCNLVMADLQRQDWSQLILSISQQEQKSPLLEDYLMSILNKINSLSDQNLKIWRYFITLLKTNPHLCCAFYELQYKQKQQKLWKSLVKVDLIQEIDLTASYNQRQGLLLKELQEAKTNLIFENRVIEQRLLNKKLSFPLTIIQSFSSPTTPLIPTTLTSPNSQLPGIHLIILVHGFQGTSYDMKLIKNNISYMYPQSMFLCCTANQDLTDKDIFDMGNRLAVEIKSFIYQNFSANKGNILGRISFIGHSLGGLKIRAALPKLLEFKDKFFMYISFSSPHLGYKVNTSSVIEAGIWILQKLKQSQCLKQLTMTDHEDPYSSTLYRLSLQEGFEYFTKIFLYSSTQDSYAPYESARIEIDPQFMVTNDLMKNIHCQMVKNLLKNVDKSVLHRAHVSFSINTKNLDSFIGRTAHIMFLEKAQVIKALAYTTQSLFK